MIHYTVSFENANAHLFEVKLNINFSLHQGQKFSLPAWIPGSYMIRDFAKNIICLKGNCKGQDISIEKLDKSSWQLLEDVECLELVYQVYAWDLSVRSAHLDNCHGFFNGTSLFLKIENYQDEEHTVIIQASQHALEKSWKVATSMASKKIDANGFGKYICDNYQDLIDHPVEIADYQSIGFDVKGIPHQMVFTEAPENIDLERIAKDVKKICETEVEFFGDNKPPFEQYVFMTFVLKDGFGGLEHMSSTALHCSFKDLPLRGADVTKIDENYRTFLSLCCHEYFHSWNVKRIKPAKFIPMDLTQEVHTELLWFFEGITSYYDELLMARARTVSPEGYLEMLAHTLTKTLRGKGRFKQSVTQSSFDTWTKFYKQDENAVNGIVSYYSKGAMVALCLDFEIRKLTDGKKSLDDLMRIVWQKYGKTGKGLGENQIEQLAKELVGKSMQSFFKKILYSVDELDLAAVFEQVDVNYQIIPQMTFNEKGGYNTQLTERPKTSYLGVVHKPDNLGAKIHSVAEGSCGLAAGLSNGDTIIAIDSVRVTHAELDKLIASYPIGEIISISYFRRERLHHTECKLTSIDPNTCYLSFKNALPSEKYLQWIWGVNA